MCWFDGHESEKQCLTFGQLVFTVVYLAHAVSYSTQILLLPGEVPGGVVQRDGVPQHPHQPTDAGRSHARCGAAGTPESGQRAGILALSLLDEQQPPQRHLTSQTPLLLFAKTPSQMFQVDLHPEGHVWELYNAVFFPMYVCHVINLLSYLSHFWGIHTTFLCKWLEL